MEFSLVLRISTQTYVFFIHYIAKLDFFIYREDYTVNEYVIHTLCMMMKWWDMSYDYSSSLLRRPEFVWNESPYNAYIQFQK